MIAERPSLCRQIGLVASGGLGLVPFLFNKRFIGISAPV